MAMITLLLFALCACDASRAFDMPDMTTYKTESAASVQTPDLTSIIKEVSFLGVGDNIIYGGNTKHARAAAIKGGRAYNFKPMYAPVEEYIAGADIAFINQEVVMAGDGYDISYYPTFNAPQELGYDLEELGFDVVNIATNHMLDKGAGGLSKTIDFWNERNVLMIGGYKDEVDFDNIRILEKDGISIAFLAYTYGTNGIKKAASSPLVIPYLNDEDIIRQTTLAKQSADMVMVSVHWGDEGAFKPNDEQKHYAKLFADCGVDVIIGHHPHVVQPVEYLEGKDGNKTLCVYSLGNFMAEQAYDYNMVGGMIAFDIVKIGENKPFLENVKFIPTVFHFSSSFLDNTVYPMTEYTPSLAAIHGVRTHYRHTLSYEKLLRYATSTIDAAFLPDELVNDLTSNKGVNHHAA